MKPSVFNLVILLALVGAHQLRAEPKALGSVAELEAFFLDNTARRQPCRIRGVLQRKSPIRPSVWELTVSDASGRRAAFATKTDWRLSAGDLIVLDGLASVFPDLETYLAATNVTVVGHGTADPPLELRLADLDERAHHLREVIVGGTVVDVFADEIDTNYDIFLLKDVDRLLPVYFRRRDDFRPEIDSRVSVRAVYHRSVSGQRKFYGPYLLLSEIAGLTVTTPAPADPFSAPPLVDLLYLSPQEILRQGRRTVTGRVLAAWNGDTLLLRTDKGLLVTVELRRTDIREPPPTDAQITASGYVDTDHYHLILTRAVFRTERLADHPPAEKSEPINADAVIQSRRGREFIDARYHGRLVTLYGHLRSLPPANSPHRRVTVESKGYFIPVDISSVPDAFSGVELGSFVRMTGRCILETENATTFNAYPKARGFAVVLRSAADVEVLERPPWWTPQRWLALIGVLFAALVGLVIRIRLQKRMNRIKFAERTALAVELHDSLSQSLAGLACVIAATDDALGADAAPARDRLKTAEQMLDSCRTELRHCLFDLRSDTLGEKNLADAVSRTLKPFEDHAIIAVRFNVRRDRVTDATAHATLSIVRELAANAVRHGNAGSIRIAGVFDRGLLHFSVTDDGCGFDPDRCDGIATGHFGLNGVRDRVRRLNGTFAITSVIGRGTKAVVRLPGAQK